jgi:hypothetical protein
MNSCRNIDHCIGSSRELTFQSDFPKQDTTRKEEPRSANQFWSAKALKRRYCTYGKITNCIQFHTLHYLTLNKLAILHYNMINCLKLQYW